MVQVDLPEDLIQTVYTKHRYVGGAVVPPENGDPNTIYTLKTTTASVLNANFEALVEYGFSA